MGLRFRKSFKVAPGVKINIGKKSAGVSFGGKYGGVSFNTKSGARARISAPGTGLSYSSKLSSGRSKRSASHKSRRTTKILPSDARKDINNDLEVMNNLTKEEQYKFIASKQGLTEKSLKVYRTIFIIIAIICFAIGIPTLTVAGAGIVFVIIGGICLYYANLYKKIRNVCYPKTK